MHSKYRKLTCVIALIFFLAGLFTVNPIFISSAAAEDEVFTAEDQAYDNDNDFDNEETESKGHVKLFGMKFRVPGLKHNDGDESSSEQNNNDWNTILDRNNDNNDEDSNNEFSSSQSGSFMSKMLSNMVGKKTANNIINNSMAIASALGLDEVAGRIWGSTFPYQTNMSDLIFESNVVTGRSFTSSNLGSLLGMKWGSAAFNSFNIHKNLVSPDGQPWHITVGSKADDNVSAQNFMVDSSELYADQISDGSSFTMDKYWTLDPEQDIPRRDEDGNGFPVLNGTNLKINANKIKANSITVPNFSITCEPGLQMSSVNE